MRTILLSTVMATFALLALPRPSAAQVTTEWLANPVDGSWGNAANWSNGNPDNSAASEQRRLVFGPSAITTLQHNGDRRALGIVFNADADNYTIQTGSGGVIYTHGEGIISNGGSHNFTAAVRPRVSSSIVNDSAGQLTFNQLMVHPFDVNAPAIYTLTFDGSGTTQIGNLQRRTNIFSVELVKQGGGTLVIAGAVAGAATPANPGVFDGPVSILDGTVRVQDGGANRLPANMQVNVIGGGSVFETANNTNNTPTGGSAIDVLLQDGGIYRMSGAGNNHQHVRNVTFVNGGRMETSGAVGSSSGNNVQLNGNLEVVSGAAVVEMQHGIGINGAHDFIVANGATLTFNNTGIRQGSGAAGIVNFSGGGTMVVNGASNFQGATNVIEGRMTVVGGASNDFMATSQINISSGAVFELQQNSGTVRLTNLNTVITGAGTFEKTGGGGNWMANNSGGTQILFDMASGGLIDLQQGVLREAATSAGNLADLRIAAGASFFVNAGGASPATARFNALLGEGTLNIDGGNPRTVIIGADNGGGTFSGVIAGGANMTVVKEGTGTQVLSGVNTFTGGLVVNNGVVQVTGPGQSGNRLAANLLVTVNGATSVFETAGVTNNTPTGGSAIDVLLQDGGTYRYSGAGNNHQHVRNVTFVNGGRMETSGAVGSYSGHNVQLNGSLEVVSGNAVVQMQHGIGINGAHDFIVANGATLTFNNTGIRQSDGAAGIVNFSGGGTMTINGDSSLAGQFNVLQGTAVLNSTMRQVGSLGVGPGATLQTGATNIWTAGHGSANNKPITIDGGTWTNTGGVNRIGDVNLLNGASWQINNANADWGTYYLGTLGNGDDATVTVGGGSPSSMSGNGNLKLGANVGFDVANTTGDHTSDLVVGVRLDRQTNAQNQAPGGFTKTGDGTMTIASSNNAYEGATTVAGGTLNVTGSITNTSAVVVHDGAVLGGSGSITTTGNSSVIRTGASLAPGDTSLLGTGTLLLQTSSLTFEPGSFWDVNLAGTDSGKLQLDSPTTLDLGNVSLRGGGSSFDFELGTGYWILESIGSGGVSGGFANMTASGPAAGLFPTADGFVDLNGTSFAVFLNAGLDGGGLTQGNGVVLFATPEPGRTMLLALAAATLLFHRRR